MAVVDLNAKRKKEKTYEDHIEECKQVVKDNIHKVVDEVKAKEPTYVLSIMLYEDGDNSFAEFGDGDHNRLYTLLEVLQQRILGENYGV